MYERVLAVITARGGSKRIPGKNVRPLSGKPLIGWTIEAALRCRDKLCGIVVSTDDAQIAEVSRALGAQVPFLRPAELAGDEAKSLPVVQHATAFIEQRDGEPVDWVLLLQPTSPLRTAADISASIDLALTADCDSVVGACELSDHPVFAKKIGADGYLTSFVLNEPEGIRRQDVKPIAYKRNGALYLTRREVLMNRQSLYGSRSLPYLMPQDRSVDIDSEVDWLLTEALLARRAAA